MVFKKLLFSTIERLPLWSCSCSNAIHHIVTYVSVSLILVLGLYASTSIAGYNQNNLQNPVDKDKCDCKCWDGFYRGLHGRGSQYKAFYFNYDPNWVLILLLFLLFSHLLFQVVAKLIKILIYELKWAVIKLTGRAFKQRVSFVEANVDDSFVGIPILQDYYLRLRVFVLLALSISIYSNYFGVWAIINYVNDRDYRMIHSQVFYTITEVVPTYIYFKTLDRYVSVKQIDSKYTFKYQPIKLDYAWPLLSISLVHILVALPEGMLIAFYQTRSDNPEIVEAEVRRNFVLKIRDLALMSNDFLAIGISLFLIAKEYYRVERSRLLNRLEVKLWSIVSITMFAFYKKFCVFKE